MTRRVFPYVPFTIEQDETATPTYEAECISGDVIECGEDSGPHHDPEPVEEWMRKHTQDTGHARYLRIFSDCAVIQPPAERGELLRVNKATA
ncbi:DUF7848 domain-containing protein [Streptomyces pinistramenti]|uniref:DUF7848 domain-containing protein n=1 Tax=Streptomyces pinistramenti TaxID=2884812 RepID=UPI001D08785B|nr:hypothetical protein [Streptomyces pinistramenti]MCB5910824.1 hypothetical protein [Streptomyces pinistramenti]